MIVVIIGLIQRVSAGTVWALHLELLGLSQVGVPVAVQQRTVGVLIFNPYTMVPSNMTRVSFISNIPQHDMGNHLGPHISTCYVRVLTLRMSRYLHYLSSFMQTRAL